MPLNKETESNLNRNSYFNPYNYAYIICFRSETWNHEKMRNQTIRNKVNKKNKKSMKHWKWRYYE